MSGLHVVAIITPAEGKKDEVQQALTDLASKVKDAEPDVHQYQFYWNQEGGEFVFIEKYADLDAYESHRKQPYMAELKERAQKEQILAKPLDIKVVELAGGFAR